jgi:hypothetical protein
MATHVKALGILHIVFGCLGILLGLAALALFGGLAALIGMKEGSPDALVGMGVLGIVGVAGFLVLLLLSLPGLIAGFGLMAFKPWARILTIVLSAIELLNVPFGTALGLYGFWVLLHPETEVLFGLRPAATAR